MARKNISVQDIVKPWSLISNVSMYVAYVSVSNGFHMYRCPELWTTSRSDMITKISRCAIAGLRSRSCPKWKLYYGTHKKALKHGRSNESSAIYVKMDGPSTGGPRHGGRASRPRGHKAKHDVLALALHETLKKLTAENEETNAKRDENGCYEKDAICASFTNLKRAMLGQTSLRLEPNCSHGENRIMLADLSIMGPANPSCFGKKPMTTLQHDV
jgi:hypothetical protein